MHSILFKDYSPGLFALNEGPKSHCPIALGFGGKKFSTFPSDSQIMCLNVPLVLWTVLRPPSFRGCGRTPGFSEGKTMAAASFVSSPCGWMTSRWGQTVAQSQNVLCARLRGWDTLRDETLLAVPVGTVIMHELLGLVMDGVCLLMDLPKVLGLEVFLDHEKDQDSVT